MFPKMVKLFLISLLLVHFGLKGNEKTLETNVVKLKELSKKFSKESRISKKNALKIAKENGLFIEGTNSEGQFVELQRFDKYNRPVYYVTNNVDAAKTVGVDKIWPGGSNGSDLSGEDMIIGEWDGGAVLASHQEFEGRVIQKDGAVSLSNHSTHVAGTLIAAGINANAKGMAYKAKLWANDWDDDDSEMANSAADGLFISNHSYGMGTGWINSTIGWLWSGDEFADEDWKMGFYDESAKNWDDIAYNAPYYLIVKAAGNDRGDGPEEGGNYKWWDSDNYQYIDKINSGADFHPKDGDYDCIGIGGAVSKNTLTVAAIKDISEGYSTPSDVEMTTFSSWGPIDDGRVKPDISANGYKLFSSISEGNDSYDTYSGTSMATPNATGTLTLLQQQYKKLNNNSLMRAATLKGLVIHTADEAGMYEGPDYSFGWGLLDADNAIKTITDASNNSENNLIIEDVLQDGQSISFTVNHNETGPLWATICWTDLSGEVVEKQLDPNDKMLVNDLDLRIKDANNTYLPYKLDKFNPSSAATKGDNDVDNVEKVFIGSAPAGNYTIEISHKGALVTMSQAFSLIVTGASSPSVPMLAVLPNIINVSIMENQERQIEMQLKNIGSEILNISQITTVEPQTPIELLSEDFESSSFPPSSWEIIGNSGIWEQGPTTAYNGDSGPGVAHSGEKCAFFDVGFDYEGEEGYFISPEFSLVGQTYAEISFWYWDGFREYNGGFYDGSDKIKLKYSIDNGVSWIGFFATPETVEEWTKMTTALPAEVMGEDNVKIAFYHLSEKSFWTYPHIDDISIAAASGTQSADWISFDANSSYQLSPGESTVFNIVLNSDSFELNSRKSAVLKISCNHMGNNSNEVFVPINMKIVDAPIPPAVNVSLISPEDEYSVCVDNPVTFVWDVDNHNVDLLGYNLYINDSEDFSEVEPIFLEQNYYTYNHNYTKGEKGEYVVYGDNFWFVEAVGVNNGVKPSQVNKFVAYSGNSEIEDNNLIKCTELFQNYPNPFNPETLIKYNIAKKAKVSISIYNAKGEMIKRLVNKIHNQGKYEMKFDASNLNSGIYYYTLRADNKKIMTKKMLLVK